MNCIAASMATDDRRKRERKTENDPDNPFILRKLKSMEQSNLMLFRFSLIRLKYCSHDYELFLEGVASSNKFLIFPFFDTCVIKKQG